MKKNDCLNCKNYNNCQCLMKKDKDQKAKIKLSEDKKIKKTYYKSGKEEVLIVENN